MMTRQEKILSCIDLATQLGTEIGSLNQPIVTHAMGNIRHAEVREELVRGASVETAWQVSSKVLAEKIQHNGHCRMFIPHSFFKQLNTLLLNLQLPQCKAVSFGK